LANLSNASVNRIKSVDTEEGQSNDTKLMSEFLWVWGHDSDAVMHMIIHDWVTKLVLDVLL
jgi:hypothetical protein